MKNRVFFASQTHQNDIDRLRMEEYAQATGFSVDLSTLRWRASDDDSFVMAAEAEGKIISTMRGEVITELPLLEAKLECPWNFPVELNFPVLLLSRAATASEHRSTGFNLALRYWFLRFAENHGIPYVIGTFVSGSPREKSLREMGYRFFENPHGWQQSTYRSLRPVHVVALNMKTHGEQAIEYCQKRAPELIASFPYQGEFPELRQVRGL